MLPLGADGENKQPNHPPTQRPNPNQFFLEAPPAGQTLTLAPKALASEPLSL
ncbi:hypothetical protein GCM10009765_57300 [Fodinicola feengrottensis]|uniref:Uncharacterized protein n=1 Tax=Fodinicola feengrottensis TaxID=435914 RepID=A0ABP4U7P7_9ACTN